MGVQADILAVFNEHQLATISVQEMADILDPEHDRKLVCVTMAQMVKAGKLIRMGTGVYARNEEEASGLPAAPKNETPKPVFVLTLQPPPSPKEITAEADPLAAIDRFRERATPQTEPVEDIQIKLAAIDKLADLFEDSVSELLMRIRADLVRLHMLAEGGA